MWRWNARGQPGPQVWQPGREPGSRGRHLMKQRVRQQLWASLGVSLLRQKPTTTVEVAMNAGLEM